MAKLKKLNKAPLKEVVFELFWSSPNDETNFPSDLELPNILKTFPDLISEQGFSLRKDLPQNPQLKIYPSIHYQYWRGELKWPVIQIGPGLFAINDVSSSYEWDKAYFPLLKEAVNNLKISSDHKLKFNKVTLRYINSVDIDEDVHYLSFLSKNLKINVSNDFQVEGKFKGINVLQSYDLEDGSILSINTQTVINNITKKPGFVWVISMEKNDNIKEDAITEWAESAHKHLSNAFYNMLNSDLYASFN